MFKSVYVNIKTLLKYQYLQMYTFTLITDFYEAQNVMQCQELISKKIMAVWLCGTVMTGQMSERLNLQKLTSYLGYKNTVGFFPLDINAKMSYNTGFKPVHQHLSLAHINII